MKRYGPVALLMAIIAAVSVLITVFTGTVGTTRRKKTVVTTVYPLYTAAQNVIGDVPGIMLENLTGSSIGCLHDYQLSPANRILLEQADLLLLNGAGAEAFLKDVLPTLTAAVVDTGAGVATLEGHDEHAHGEEHAHEQEANEHIWVSPTRYAAQVQAVTDALCALDPANRHAYVANGAAYLSRVAAVAGRLREIAAVLNGRPCITFHDSLAYLAEELKLPVAASLSMGEEGGVSAGDIAAAQRAVHANPAMLLLYDNQYTVRYTALDRLVPTKQVLALDTAVIGSGRPEDWLSAMEHNITLLEQITEE